MPKPTFSTPGVGKDAPLAPSANPKSSLEPFPLEATQHILECPHILEAIVALTPRGTQHACLLTSRSMFEAAGRVLYRNVYLGGRLGDRFDLFFRGALIGTGLGDEEAELAKCPLANGRSECKIHHSRISDNFASLSDGEGPIEPAANPPSASSETPPKTKTQKRNERRRKKDKKEKKKGWAEDNQTKDVPHTTNFKLSLLRHVRVLTISTHHACDCRVYGPHTRRLLPNLEIVRVASDFLRTFELLPVCDARVCKLLCRIKCHKLVLRIIDGNGLPLEPMVLDDPFPICQELVVFLPTDARRLTTDWDNVQHWHYRSLQELGGCFPNAPNTKIVFYPNWEGWDASDDAFAFIHGHAPVTPDDIVYSMSDFLQYEDPQYTIYGMGKLRWVADGDIAGTFKRFFPNTELTQRAILDLVRHELRTGSLFLALGFLSRDDNDFEYDPGYPERYTYKTFNDYIKDKDARGAEITAYD